MRGLTTMFSTANKSAKSGEQQSEPETVTAKLKPTKPEAATENYTSSTLSRGEMKKKKKKEQKKTKTTTTMDRVGGEGEDGGSGGEKYVHCALLGDGMVGKTSLTLSYTQQVFSDSYTATVFDNYPVPVCVGEEDFTISVFDTAGQKDYESLRAYTYQCSEVLVLCFSVCDRESFYSVLNSWLPEIQHHTKGKRPLLLVGTQIDLRRNPSSSPCFPGDLNTLCGDLDTLSASSWDLGTLSSLPATFSTSTSSRGRYPRRHLKTPFSSSAWDLRTTSPSCSSDEPLSAPSTPKTPSSSSSSKVRTSSRSPYPNASTSSSSSSSPSSSPGPFVLPSSPRNSLSTISSSSSSSTPSSTNSSFSSADLAPRPFSTYSSCSSSSACSTCWGPGLEPNKQEEEQEQDEVSWEEGSQLAKMIGADCYIECSARSQEGVREVFQHVVFSALKYRKKKRGSLLGRLLFRERRSKPLMLSGKTLQRAASTLNIPVV